MKLVFLLGLWLWGAPAPELPQETPPEKILEPPTVPAAPVPPGSTRLDTSTPPEAPAAPEPAAAPAPPTIPAQAAAGLAVGPSFGAPGQLVPAIAVSTSLGYVGANAGERVVTGFLVEPAVHYFWSEDASVGLDAFLSYGDSPLTPQLTEESWTYGGAAEMGVNHRLGDRVSLWARLGLGYARTEATYSAPGNAVPPVGVVENALVFRMFTPFLLHATSGFFVGLGPDFYLDVLHSGGGDTMRRSFVGIAVTVGGWR